MRIPIIGATVILSVAMLSNGAIAQPVRGPASGPPLAYTTFPTQVLGDIYSQSFRQSLSKVKTDGKAIDRANRVSLLIDQGKCDDARQLAANEGDGAMAARVPGLCHAHR